LEAFFRSWIGPADEKDYGNDGVAIRLFDGLPVSASKRVVALVGSGSSSAIAVAILLLSF
jgi:hypothetical protein